MRRAAIFGALVLAGSAAAAFVVHGRAIWHPQVLNVVGRRTTADVLRRLGPEARARLQPHLDRAGVAWPPRRVRLLGLKQDKRLELWASGDAGPVRFVRSWDVLAASGGPGPKLREGDRQVPEGVYRLTVLNPNSSYHLSVRVEYPNAFDRARAAEERRTGLGGDIYIHGKAVSIGCLAIGDEAIEELFVLLADTGLSRADIVIVPSLAPAPVAGSPPWVSGLYVDLRRELAGFERGR